MSIDVRQFPPLPLCRPTPRTFATKTQLIQILDELTAIANDMTMRILPLPELIKAVAILVTETQNCTDAGGQLHGLTKFLSYAAL